LPIAFPNANFLQAGVEKLSKDGDGRILLKISALHLLGKTYRIKPFSSSSISQDRTFKSVLYINNFLPDLGKTLKDLGQFSNAAKIRLIGQKIEILIRQVYILQ
jgi:hypothetical protein